MQRIQDPEWYKKEVWYIEHHPLNKYVRKSCFIQDSESILHKILGCDTIWR